MFHEQRNKSRNPEHLFSLVFIDVGISGLLGYKMTDGQIGYVYFETDIEHCANKNGTVKESITFLVISYAKATSGNSIINPFDLFNAALIYLFIGTTLLHT